MVKEPMVLDDLKSITRIDADLESVRMPTYVLADDDDAGAAVGAIIDRFGADRAQETVRLRFTDETRYLSRRDLYAAFTDSDKGFGSGGQAQLPGYPAPRGAREYQFRCPHNGCPDSPVFVLSFTEPPVCPRHHLVCELVR
jgi:hypothetical protein